MPDSTVRRLHAIRADYSAGHEKAALMDRLTDRPPTRLADVRQLHDDLLFLRAFPDSPQVLQAAERALGAFDRAVRRLGARRHRADESGMTGTDNHDAYSFDAVEWLESSFPGEVDIDWPRVPDEAAIDGLLRPAVQSAEEEAFESGELTTRQWIVLRKGARRETDLACLLRLAPTGGAARRAYGAMYDAAEIPLRWRLDGSAGAVTHTALPVADPAFRRRMRTTPTHPARHIASPTRAVRRIEGARARQVVHAARVALASRGREVFAAFASNPHEVYLGDLGDGASIAIIGVRPDRRLSLEANYAYVMFANGVPIGYGGVTALYRQANTGLNIFPAYRGSEAAYLWVAALRVFHSLFRVKRFVVNANQVGEGNREAIASGAFWFYYRLGFRPAHRDTRALARREFLKLGRRGRRTDTATLRQLAHGDLHLDVGPVGRGEFFDESWLIALSRGATRQLAAAGAAGVDVAERAVADRLARTLGCGHRARWPAGERQAFERLAPVCAQLPDLDALPANARRGLVNVMRAKGRAQERDFVLAAQRNRWFYPRLIALASRGATERRPTTR